MINKDKLYARHFMCAFLRAHLSLFFLPPLYADVSKSVLVDVSWLSTKLDEPGITIVDVRKEKEYLNGHIPGAINIPVNITFNPEPPSNRVGNLIYIQKLFSQYGIRYEDAVIVYGDSTYIDAGRVFWVFEVYGHNNVRLLNGGYPGWLSKKTLPVSKDRITPQPSNFVPRIDPNRLATKFSMRLALNDPSAVIIDARARDEYEGEKSEANRFGHIPGAINIPWHVNFTEDNGVKMLKPREELEVIYSAHAKDRKTLLYCNRGEHAALNYTVMRQLGYDAAHYDGSWLEWGNDKDLPIEVQ